jgi:hypothetical protein
MMRFARPSAIAVLPTKDLDRPLDLVIAADQRVDLALLRLLVEVDAVVGERVLATAAARLFLLLRLLGRLVGGGRALDGAVGRAAGCLGDAVGDEVHRIQPRHVLQLQEVDGMALPLGEEGDEHIGARHLVPAGGLDMDGRALDDPLEAGSRLRVAGALGHEAREVLVEELGQVALQLVIVDTAGAQHGRRVGVVGEGEKEVLQCRVFVPAFIGQSEGAVERLLEIAGQHA